MNHFVRLEQLPDGLSFPTELLDRVSYDESRKLLGFRGFMAKADFDQLSRLSENWGYRRSLEELFRLCSLPPEPAPRNRIASVLSRILSGRSSSAS